MTPPAAESAVVRLIRDAIEQDRDMCAKSIASQATPLISHDAPCWIEGRPKKTVSIDAVASFVGGCKVSVEEGR